MQPYNQRRPAKSGNGAAFHVAIVWAVTCPMGLFGLGGLSHTHTFATTNQSWRGGGGNRQDYCM